MAAAAAQSVPADDSLGRGPLLHLQLAPKMHLEENEREREM